jgi:hypothetical protein
VTEAVAKKQLRRMLWSLTPGSVLHLLAELHREVAEQADDDSKRRQLLAVEAALFVVGLGIDAALPR